MTDLSKCEIRWSKQCALYLGGAVKVVCCASPRECDERLWSELSEGGGGEQGEREGGRRADSLFCLGQCLPEAYLGRTGVQKLPMRRGVEGKRRCEE